VSISIVSNSPSETKRLGERLARRFQAGDVVLLQGELGAGKTCLAQGIGRGLKVAEAVKSSSFVLVNEYSGRLKVYHADLFRLDDPEAIDELGLEENAADGLLLVEWAERAWDVLPPEHLLVSIAIGDDGARTITLTPRGKRYEALLAGLGARAGA
jgi:tRNA threonylcarbamoyladenosine biosynthesis protein TsaE